MHGRNDQSKESLMSLSVLLSESEKSNVFHEHFYKDTLTDYLEEINVSIEELYMEVREAQTETTDPFLKTFIDCLLASADYDSFYKVPAMTTIADDPISPFTLRIYSIISNTFPT